MKRKKNVNSRLLAFLIALFVVGVGYWASAPHREISQVWTAPVRVVPRHDAPAPLEHVEVPESNSSMSSIETEATLPLPAEEAHKKQQLALYAQPRLPKRDHRRDFEGDKPRIAIVIDDMGLSVTHAKRAIALPAAVTLSFLPYGKQLTRLADKAREAGHEVMLHLPMEPLGHENPGPGALLVAQSSDEMRERIEKGLDSFSGYDGVNNHMGSRFTADYEGMRLVMEALRDRGLFFLDSFTSPRSVGAQVAREMNVRTEVRDVFIDDDLSLTAIGAQLAQTQRLARRNGFAIAIGHPNAATLTALERWIPEAESEGFAFVPVREVVR